MFKGVKQMRVFVNGRDTEIGDGLTVGALVSEKGFSPESVVIEYNSEILPREKWSQRILAAEDKLEIITFVGGG